MANRNRKYMFLQLVPPAKGPTVSDSCEVDAELDWKSSAFHDVAVR